MYESPKEFKTSTDGKLQVELVGWIEPNHYNLCMQVEIFYEDKDIGRSIRDKIYKMAYLHLDKWIIDDPNNDNDYYYIPMIERTVILDKQTLKSHYLNYKNEEEAFFIGNYFEDYFLVENFYEDRVITNLKTLATYQIDKKQKKKAFKIEKIKIRPSKFSVDKKIEIKFLKVEEPHSGRVLWKVSIFYEETNLNEFIFQNEWNYLNFELDNWILEDYMNDYYYIPAESKSILINKNTLKVHYLPKQPISTVLFKGNYFKGNYLIEKYHKMVVKTDLNTLISEEIAEESQLKIPFPLIRGRKY